MKIFNEKHKLDIASNSRALLRLRVGCEKLKTVLSANPQGVLSIESIMNDCDVSAALSRQEFEGLTADLLYQLEPMLQQLIEKAGMTIDQVDSIEMVGGTTSIQLVKQKVMSFFKKELSFTLNRDEAIARGCALQCAMLSPSFKVRDFSVNDIGHYDCEFSWIPQEWDMHKNPKVSVFAVGESIGKTKHLTLQRKEPFEVEITQKVPEGMEEYVGRFLINKVQPLDDDPLASVRIRSNQNANGIVGVTGAYIAQEVMREVEEGEGDEKRMVMKKFTKKHELPVQQVAGNNLDKKVVQQLMEKENEMTMQDKLIADTEEKKNALEEFVYDMRSKLDDRYQEFCTEEEKDALMKRLNSTEDWLYGDGEDASKSEYSNYLDQLKQEASLITQRYYDYVEFESAAERLSATVKKFREAVLSDDPRYAHISTEERQQIEDQCSSDRDWLKECKNMIAAQSKTVSIAGIATAAQLLAKEKELVMFATKILNKPPPPPPAPENTEEKDVEMADTEQSEQPNITKDEEENDNNKMQE